MNISIKHHKSERGQALMEFVATFPLLFLVFMLIFFVAAVWYAHHISAVVSLEGASLEGKQSGWGTDFVYRVGNSLYASVDFTITIDPNSDFSLVKLAVGSFQRFTVSDDFSIPWAPKGLRGAISIQGTTYAPVWEFSGGSE